MRVSLLIAMHIIAIASFAQHSSHFAFGADVGYKGSCAASGFVVEYHFKNKLSAFIATADGKFVGSGYAAGLNLYGFNRVWQPVLGIAFNYQAAKSFYMGDTGHDRSDYYVPSSNNLVYTLGVRKIQPFDDPGYHSVISFLPYLSYRISLTNTQVILEDGLYREDREIRINNRIQGGMGFGVKLIYIWHGNNMNWVRTRPMKQTTTSAEPYK